MRLVVLALLFVVLGSGTLRADALHWVNPAGGSYHTASNWDLTRVPVSGDNIVFDLDAAYSVSLDGATNDLVNRVEINRGTVTLAGPGTLNIQAQAPDNRVVVGSGAGGTLVVDGSTIYATSEVIEVRMGGTLVVRTGGDIFTGFSDLQVQSGGILRVEGGVSNPGALRFQGGRGVVTAGLMNGRVVSMTPGSEVVASGSTSRFTCQDAMQVSGTVTVSNGARVEGVLGQFSFSAVGCHMVLSGGGRASLVGVQTDEASVMDVRGGGVWHVAGQGEFHGALLAAAAADVQLRGNYHSTVDLDQAATITRSTLTLDQGLTVELDGLAQPATPVIPAASFESATILSGPLTVRIRNSNALRVGDVYPVFGHEAGSAQAFSSLVAPNIGGGRVLQMVRSGSPAITSVQVVAGSPSCFLNADFDGDEDSGTDADIEAFFACVAGSCCATCASADFNGDGDVATDADIEAFFRILAGQPC
jgi:hypothetical protein